MTTVKVTIDDSLPFSDLRTVLSLIRGVAKIEIADQTAIEKQQGEYEQLKNAFLCNSKLTMSNQINKYL
jgi:hypothetical protein